MRRNSQRGEPVRDPIFGMPAMTFDEIGAALGCSKMAAERVYFRALRKARKQLGLPAETGGSA